LDSDRVARRDQRLCGLAAPTGRDDRALRDEYARDQLRLLDQAATIGAQVQHDAERVLVEHAIDALAHFAVRARAERRKRDHTELDAAHGLDRGGGDRL
jgi:hypothetical protein